MTVTDPSHQKGAVSELLAAAYYASKGYQVYWPTIRQGPVDMVVESPEGKMLRVQVKTAVENKSGPWTYIQSRMLSTGKVKYGPADGKYDIAFVVHGDEMWAIPAVALKSSNISLGSNCPTYGGCQWDSYRVSR